MQEQANETERDRAAAQMQLEGVVHPKAPTRPPPAPPLFLADLKDLPEIPARAAEKAMRGRTPSMRRRSVSRWSFGSVSGSLRCASSIGSGSASGKGSISDKQRPDSEASVYAPTFSTSTSGSEDDLEVYARMMSDSYMLYAGVESRERQRAGKGVVVVRPGGPRPAPLHLASVETGKGHQRFDSRASGASFTDSSTSSSASGPSGVDFSHSHSSSPSPSLSPSPSHSLSTGETTPGLVSSVSSTSSLVTMLEESRLEDCGRAPMAHLRLPPNMYTVGLVRPRDQGHTLSSITKEDESESKTMGPVCLEGSHLRRAFDARYPPLGMGKGGHGFVFTVPPREVEVMEEKRSGEYAGLGIGRLIRAVSRKISG